MKDNIDIKNKWLHVRLNDAEYKQLHDLFSRTTERKLGRYARKVLLSVPVTVNHRNQSLDDIVTVLTRLQSDLNGVANNYNQMVHKLHMLDKIPEFKTWVMTYEREKGTLQEKISTVKDYISKTAEQWLR